jgi:sugar lactone lactonase YvrE
MATNLLVQWAKKLTKKMKPGARRARSGAVPRATVSWRPSIEFLEDRTTPTQAVVAASYYDSAVYALNPSTGAVLQTLVAPNSQSVLDGPAGMAVGPDGNLYFSSQNNNSIVEYNVTTGALTTFISSTTLNQVATANGDSAFAPAGLTFGPDGDLYVSLNGGQSASNGAVVRFDITSSGGQLSYTGVEATVATGLVQPTGLTFGPASNPDTLYVSNSAMGTVVQIANATSASPTSSTFISAGSGGLNYPTGLTWGSNGDLYVTDKGATSQLGQVLVYSPSGSFVQVFTQPASSLENEDPTDALFLPDGDLITANVGATEPASLGGSGTSGSISEFNSGGVYTQQFSAAAFPAAAGTGVTNFSPSELALVDLPSLSPPAPTVSVSAVSTFNPQGPLTIGVSSTATGVESVTVNWGDGTVQTYSGAPGSYSHQYVVASTTYTIQVSVTTASGTTSAPATRVSGNLATTQEGQVAALYLDLLGRSVDPSGLSYWSGVLASGGTLAQVISGITSSSEYQDNLINNLYERYLGRAVDSSGLASSLALLQSGGPQAVASALLDSSEFFVRAGSTYAGFLQVLYATVLDRTIDSGSLSSDLSALNAGMPDSDIVAGVLNSGEAEQDTIERAYEIYLGRPADPAGLQAWEQSYSNNESSFLELFLTAAGPELAQQAATDTTVVPAGSIYGAPQ